MEQNTTLDKLKAFRSLREECIRAKRQIKSLADKTAHSAALLAAEKRKKFPHLYNLMTEEGLALNRQKIEDKKIKLSENEARLRAMLDEIAELLKSVADQEIRETIELYYIDGLNYMQVAECMGDPGDGTTQMKRVRRYFKRLDEERLPRRECADKEGSGKSGEEAG